MSVTLEAVERQLRGFIGDIDPATKKGRKRAAILDVASKMFVEQGYRDTSMDQIAAAVGVAKGTLYLYFPQKIDLLFACTAREKLEWLPAFFDTLTGPGRAADRLKRFVVMLLLLPSRSPLMCRLLEGGTDMSEIVAQFPSELLREGEAQYTELIQPLLDELAGPGHRWNAVELSDRATVIAAIAAFAPMLRHDWLRRGMSGERFAAIVADLIVDGLRPASPKATEP